MCLLKCVTEFLYIVKLAKYMVRTVFLKWNGAVCLQSRKMMRLPHFLV